MKHNRAFWRALYGLAHPISIGAVGVLLLNDHWLRWRWPTWWTGKIGDVAWLCFAPLLLAATLAWLWPFGLARREEQVGRLAFGLTGLVFALAKTLPAAHALTVGALAWLLGRPVPLQRDPTDLLALPALGVGWWLWRRGAAWSVAPPRRGWAVLALGALATLANQPRYDDYGFLCLTGQEARIVAIPGPNARHYSAFYSVDGGLTWQKTPSTDWERDVCTEHYETWVLPDPVDGRVQYRFTPGKEIARSQDGGETWTREIAFPWNEARVVYYERTRWEDALSEHLGPRDALIHRPTGNVVVAMGYEGILVRTAGAEWRWKSVGPYRRLEVDPLEQMQFLLSDERWLALALIFLTFGTLTRRWHSSELGWWVLIMAWSVWGLVAVAVPPAISYDTDYIFVGTVWNFYAGMLFFALGAVPLALYRGWRLVRRSRRAFGLVGATALCAALLFFLPHVLWGLGIVPFYRLATAIAVLLVVGTLAVADERLKRYFVPSGVDEGDATPALAVES